MNDSPKKQIALVILDGWGIHPGWAGNPLSLSRPGFMSTLWQNYPHLALEAFSLLESPYRRVGTSEIGFMSLGAGRMVEEALTTITRFIDDGVFFRNKAMLGAIQNSNKTLHLIGLISDSAVQSHIDHLEALIKMAAQNNVKNLYVHGILDGLDVPPRSGYHLLEQVNQMFKRYGLGEIVSLVGRSQILGNNQKEEKIKQVAQAIINGQGVKSPDLNQSLISYYGQGINDEDMPLTVLFSGDDNKAKILAGQAATLFNVRNDKTAVLSGELAQVRGLNFVSFVNQLIDTQGAVAFPVQFPKNNLSEVLNRYDISQKLITESLKRYHLEYFFQGPARAKNSDQSIIIDSGDTSQLTRFPELKAKEITNEAIGALRDGVQFVVCAYANPDVLGHAGDMDALERGIDFLLAQLERLYKEVLSIGGSMVVTADHGNAEQLLPNNFDWYARRHTKNPVPFVLVTPENKADLYHHAVRLENDILSQVAKPEASLADVAPTILELFNLPIPAQMTGKSLINQLK